MLKLAFPYQEKLNQAWQAIVFNEKYQFYNSGSWWRYKVELDNSSWDNIQMVSVGSNDNVLGYFGANIDRQSNKVSNIGAINFEDLNVTFSKDLYQFLTELFTKHKFRKIEWYVVVGNPAEKLYDKIIEKYGGRIVGIRREATITADGVMRDEKQYEIFKSEYDARTDSTGKTVPKKEGNHMEGIEVFKKLRDVCGEVVDAMEKEDAEQTEAALGKFMLLMV